LLHEGRSVRHGLATEASSTVFFRKSGQADVNACVADSLTVRLVELILATGGGEVFPWGRPLKRQRLGKELDPGKIQTNSSDRSDRFQNRVWQLKQIIEKISRCLALLSLLYIIEESQSSIRMF
jgi:hypothetical protein